MPSRPSLQLRRLAALATGGVVLAGLVGAGAGPLAAPVSAAQPSGHAFLSDSSGGTRPRSSINAGILPPGFSDTTVFSGLPASGPTKVAFGPDGKIWVLLKPGQVEYFDGLGDSDGPTLFADLSGEVDSYWDRGLMGLAVSPTFASDHTVYVQYAYNHNPVTDLPNPPAGAPAQWSPADGCPADPGGTTDGCTIEGRISKLVGTPSGAPPNVTWSVAETPLVTDYCQQFPSHSNDDLAFGPDGYLYATAGDGASFGTDAQDLGDKGGTRDPIVTPANPCNDPPGAAGTPLSAPTGEGGALRSQSIRRATGEPVSLDGALIRINPATGAGVAGNPYFSSGNQNAKRIVAYGFRNPFRFTFRPGTSEIWIGDVGYSLREEINRLSLPAVNGSNNFGWPCREGDLIDSYYTAGSVNLCTSLSSAVAPYYYYRHVDPITSGEVNCTTGGSSISGLAFYSGASYPAQYQGALFFTDHSRNCIWAMLPGGNGLPDSSNIKTIVDGGAGAVDLEVDPSSKDIFYVDFDDGTIHRLRYGAPQAVAGADVTNGAAPLTVHFDGSASSTTAPPLSYAWDLDGNGTYGDPDDTSATNTATPVKTYATPGNTTVRLRVTDANGVSSLSPPLVISAGDTPPVPVIDLIDGAPPPAQPASQPPDGKAPPGIPQFWSVGQTISFSGHASDAQQPGGIPASHLSWSVTIYHCPSNCHTHGLEQFPGTASGSFAAPDHDYPAYLGIHLTATDAQGLSATSDVYLFPKVSTLTFQSSPSGLSLAVGATSDTTPFQGTFIDGGSVSVKAPALQLLGGATYGFVAWSDGGAASHTLTVPSADTTYTATYAPLTRIAGPDRYGTSAAAAALFPSGAPVVYIATGENFPDALAGAAIAGSHGAPVLLVHQNGIPASIETALANLQPGRIVILGSTDAVSQAVADQLVADDLGGDSSRLERWSGSDRYGTAADAVAHAFPGTASRVYVVTGEDYPDALAAAPLAAQQGAPLLLVRKDSVPATIRAQLVRLKPASIEVVGSAGAVSDAVLADLDNLTAPTGGATRIAAGTDRYDTAAKVADLMFPGSTPPDVAYVATGLAFPDALSAAAVAGLHQGPVLLVRRFLALPGPTSAELNALAPRSIVVLGSSGAVSDAVFAALAPFVGP
ncbi:MAG: cell wall-binding repeat-containing protein [Candidatus Limnocylindrales bacterium]